MTMVLVLIASAEAFSQDNPHLTEPSKLTGYFLYSIRL